MQFTELQIDPRLLQAVQAAGFTTLTDIQRDAIPVVLEGLDVMASAQTGTGKTAAFVLPILHRLLTSSAAPCRGPRVLVLTPTRELATQVDADIRKLGRFCRTRAGSVVGGVSYGPQIKLMRGPLDVLVATPGRLMDHMAEGAVDFSNLEVLVLDEADRMLDMGFIRDVRKIAAATPKSRQTLLFSATLEGEVFKIAKELMRNPVRIQLAENKRRHEDIRQHVFQADDADHKHRLLAHHLFSDAMKQAVVFTRTKRRADRLATQLSREGHDCAALHGDMGQGARRRTVDQMRAGQLRVLVATDLAARGLDIKGISHVINFDMPMVAEDYIHRIGRTGRAGASGTAISLVGPEDWELFSGIQRLTGWELARETILGLEPVAVEPSRAFRGHGKARPGGVKSNSGYRGGPRGGGGAGAVASRGVSRGASAGVGGGGGRGRTGAGMGHSSGARAGAGARVGYRGDAGPRAGGGGGGGNGGRQFRRSNRYAA